MSTSAIYDDAYFDHMREADAIRDARRPSLYDTLLAIVKGMPLRNMHVLDAGCGRGELAVLLRQAGAARVDGIDFSPEAVRRATSLVKRSLGDDDAVRIVHGSLQDAEAFSEGLFDLALMIDVVEHLPRPVLRQALANVGTWLKPGGTLLVHTFPTLGVHRLYNGVMRMAGRGAIVEQSNRIHCNVQTRRRLRRTLAEAGYVCERLWLQNDLTLTSSVYQNIRSHRVKRAAKFIAEDLVTAPVISRALAAVGLAEFAKPSIYCLCTKRTPGGRTLQPGAMRLGGDPIIHSWKETSEKPDIAS